MTLAFHGKSRRRQASLIAAAVIALLGAIIAGIATRDAAPASADTDPYSASFAIYDMADSNNTLRPYEWAWADFQFQLHEDLAGGGLLAEMEVVPQVQVASYEILGRMPLLDCSISIVAFSCDSDGIVAPAGNYRMRFLVRHRTSACLSGPFTLTAYITHPGDTGSPSAVESNTLNFDCDAPPLLAPEVKIGVEMASGNPPGAVPFPLTIAEPDEPIYQRYPTFGSPTMFTTTGGSTFITIEPPGGMEVVGSHCSGLGSAQLTGNQLRLTLETGEASDCVFLLRAPLILVDACYEGVTGQQATGARWGFFSQNITNDTPILDNRMIPTHPDHPVPFDAADFLAQSGQDWQWSDPIVWDTDRDFLIDWDVRYGIGTHLGVSIKAPADSMVTAENRCASGIEPIDLSLVICNFAVDETDVDQPARFGYYVNGEFLLNADDSNGGGDTCFPAYLTVPDLAQPILVEQVTPPSWQHAPNSPERRVIHYQDNPQASRPGESVDVQFAEGKGSGIICYEAGIIGLAGLTQLPGTGLACHVIFENIRAETTSTPTPTFTPTSTPTEAPTASSTHPTGTPTGSSSPAPTQPVEQTATATPAGDPATPNAPGVPTDPRPEGDPPPATAEPSSSGGGPSPDPESTVAGERTPAPVDGTPLAPSTGETTTIAGEHPSVWAVLACFLFAASIGSTVVALWRKDR